MWCKTSAHDSRTRANSRTHEKSTIGCFRPGRGKRDRVNLAAKTHQPDTLLTNLLSPFTAADVIHYKISRVCRWYSIANHGFASLLTERFPKRRYHRRRCRRQKRALCTTQQKSRKTGRARIRFVFPRRAAISTKWSRALVTPELSNGGRERKREILR